MDNLARDAFLARQNGMSYGQYMAKFKPKAEPITKRQKPKEEVTRNICKHCGKEFVQYDNRKRWYCSHYCKQAADTVRQRERKKAKNEQAENAGDE